MLLCFVFKISVLCFCFIIKRFLKFNFDMGRKRDLSAEKKSRICALLQIGMLSQREIARIEEVSHQSVMRIAQRIKENIPSTSTSRQNCRRKRKTTIRDDRQIVKLAKENRFMPLKSIHRNVRGLGLNISERTVRRRLYESGLKCRRPVKKPKLTERMKKARYNFAKQYRDYTVDDWKKVIFSDESKVEALTERAQYVRRFTSERFKEDCTAKTVKHPASVMIWSCITAEGPGPLYFVNGTMNQNQYKKVIDECLTPHISTLDESEGPYVFMHDNAPCHRAKSVKEHLRSVNLQLLDWPGNSPDMNPIENVWNSLQNIVSSRNCTSKQALMDNITDIWQNNEHIKNCILSAIESMPRRIAALIKAKGGHTKY